MFKELLAIYKSADDKTNLFRDQIPEDKYDAVMSALETEDEAKFNDVMNSEPVTNEPVESIPAETPEAGAPEVESTESIVDDSTLPEGPIVDQPEVFTEDQQKVIIPTLNAVMKMTQDIKEAPEEEIAELPEDVKEGVEIWRDADEDFSIKIIATMVDRFHKGDFSEIEEPSEKDILLTGAEVAKELKEAGEHKTSLNRATEDIQADLESARISDLIRIHGELCSMEAEAKDLVEDVIEKNNLAVTPSQKEELIDKVLDSGIYEDIDKDAYKKNVAEVITESKDYSSRDMSVQLDIFNDFSEIEMDFNEEISPDTAELLESVDTFDTAKNLVTNAIVEVVEEDPEAFEKVMESNPCSLDASKLDAIKGTLSSLGHLSKDWITNPKNLTKVGGAVVGGLAALPGARAVAKTDEDDSTGDKIAKKAGGLALVTAGALGGTALGAKLGDKIGTKAGDSSEGDEAPAEGQVSQEVIDNALSNDDQIRALVEKYKMLPTVEAKDQMKADMQTLGFTDEVIQMIEQYAEGNFSETKSDMSEEAPAAEICPNCGQDPCVCEAPAEEPQVDVAAMVSPELFDNLLGFDIGEADPADGTLPVGEVEAPGTELGHLGTIEQGIPAGEPAPEDDKEVTKIEIVNPEGDNFDSIMR